MIIKSFLSKKTSIQQKTRFYGTFRHCTEVFGVCLAFKFMCQKGTKRYGATQPELLMLNGLHTPMVELKTQSFQLLPECNYIFRTALRQSIPLNNQEVVQNGNWI